MAIAVARASRICGVKIREFGERLRNLKSLRRPLRHRGPDMRQNDGWSPQDVERSWQEYGDGGDSWWAGT